MSQELQGDNIPPSDSDHRMERIWSDFESVEAYLEQDPNGGSPIEGKVELPPAVAAATTSAPLQVYFSCLFIRFGSLNQPPGRISRGVEHT